MVVAGPTRDGTHELLEQWRGRIKVSEISQRNLSESRNAAVALSSGEILAYLDDDAIPEPEWLSDAIPAFSDGRVGVVGGFLHNHTGNEFQWEWGTADRFGAADQSWTRAAVEFNFPFSFHFPHVMGANLLLRRSALVDVGGFDEQYEYYLDETDVTCRIVDAGWQVAQLDRAFVHHKYLPSDIRGESKVLRSWYPIIKNRLYFSLMNGRDHATFTEILEKTIVFVGELRDSLEWAISEGHLHEADRLRFEEEADRALRAGLTNGLEGVRRTRAAEYLRGDPNLFLPFIPLLPGHEQRCFCFMSQGYPPDQTGGVGTWVRTLARAIARRGHQVHVLTKGVHHDRVDLEDGVWVHRIVIPQSGTQSPHASGAPTRYLGLLGEDARGGPQDRCPPARGLRMCPDLGRRGNCFLGRWFIPFGDHPANDSRLIHRKQHC